MKANYYPILSIIFISLATISNSYANRGAPWVGNNFKGVKCFDDRQTYGPYSYTNSSHRRKNLPIVENFHFTPKIQQLIKGKTGYLVDDIAYTLRAFPNHYKALAALTYYQVLFKLDIKKGRQKTVTPSVECYFQRAFNFTPKDARLHMLYAVYLKKTNRYELADEQYRKAIEMEPDNLKYHYLYGGFLLKQRKYSLAKEQAKIVYEKKYPTQSLKQKLIAAGHWEEE